MSRVILGGSFDYLHKGHRTMLDRAFSLGDSVLIGVTSDEFKPQTAHSFEERRRAVENYVAKFGKDYEIVELNDPYGPSTDGDFDIIVVSRETYSRAEEINRIRRERGLKELRIEIIPTVVGQDLLPISSSRIRAGLIDAEGRRLKPIRVYVGSENPSKISAVESIFSSIFHLPLDVKGFAVDSGVPPQPRDDDTVRGAINRARSLPEGYDYAIGLEAGLFWNEVVKEYFDKAFCAILDSYGKFTYGYSGGFVYPPKVIEMVESGLEVGEAMERISGIREIKKGMGAIGFLSKGLIDRKEFNSQAVLMAMVPRISYKLY